MIGLDTNVIVRYLVQDDPVQARRATEFIERRLTPNAPGYITVVALVETVWVLERSYGVAAKDIAAAVDALLGAQTLVIECEQAVFSAKIALTDGRGSFADALIGALGAQAGCTHTISFDRKAARLSEFVLL